MDNNRVWNLVWDTNVLARNSKEMDGTLAGFVFDDFELAKAEMLKVIDKYVHSNNGLFDGNGGIVGLKEFIELNSSEEDFDDEFDDEDFDDEFEDGNAGEFAEELRNSILSGFKQKPESLYWNEGGVEIVVDSEEVNVNSDDSFPVEDVSPTIRINMFDMTNPEKDYFFYITNTFGYECVDDIDESRFLNVALFSQPMNEIIDINSIP